MTNLSVSDSPLNFTLTVNALLLVDPKDSSTYTVPKSHPLFEDVKAAIQQKDWRRVRELSDIVKQVHSASLGRMRVEGSTVMVQTDKDSWWAVPSDLGQTILTYMRDGLDFDRLVKFAINLSKNTSYKSVQELFMFLTKHGLTITENGNFIAYKGVRQDFKDIYSGTFDNSPGQRPSMPREKVDDERDRTCSHGLHVANHHYAHNFMGNGRIVMVEVNPKDVVSVPSDHNDEKIRVCEYLVLKESPDPIVGPTYNVNPNWEENDEDGCSCDCCDSCEKGCEFEQDYDNDKCPDCDLDYGCCDCPEE